MDQILWRMQKIIVSELEKYSEKLAQKPRWLVFNKVDLLDAEEAKEKAKAIVEALGWDENYYMIAAINQEGVKKTLLEYHGIPECYSA